MALELIRIGCKLPHGMWLEVGIEHTPGVWGGVVKTPKYAKVLLNGWHAEWMKRNPTIQPIAMLNPEPGLTDIPKVVWDAWVEGSGKSHPARLNNLIFVVPKGKENEVAVLQAAESLKSGFEPLDPNKLPDEIFEAPVANRQALSSKKHPE